MHSMSSLTSHPSQSWVDLWIEITPYENRIVIPTIGKNIPLIDIKQKKVEWVNELNDIFMKELENGVIRYPGSAKPWEIGNSFIFWHSSNFPWLEGEYNDVFSLLDKVTFEDEVIVYYGQEKYTYKIRTKNVISPGDVSVLENESDDDRSKLTLMTCWPIGTTLNRLVLTGELISVE
jgi:LPXTG-site transpeptidase (sortase) family protein